MAAAMAPATRGPRVLGSGRRNSLGGGEGNRREKKQSDNSSVESESSRVVDELEWSSFLSGLDGAVRRAAAASAAASTSGDETRPRLRRRASHGDLRRRRRSGEELPSQNLPPRSASLPSVMPSSHPRGSRHDSALRRGRFSFSAADAGADPDDECHFVDAFLARSEGRLRAHGREIRFDTPTVYHFSQQDGQLQWMALSWASDPSSPSLPAVRTDALTYARRKRRETSDLRHQKKMQTQMARWQMTTGMAPSSFATAADNVRQ